MKKQRKYYYIQDWGTYQKETIIFVGYNKQEILKVLKKYKNIEKLTVAFEKEEDDKDVKYDNYCFFYDHHDIVSLEKWEDTWNYIDILAHEVHHLIFNFTKLRGMKDESEAQAYQFEHLFRSIRTKLNKVFSKKKSSL